MSTVVQHESARIYQFPVGGRAAVGAHRAEGKPNLEHEMLRNAKAVIGGSWYHEAAIQDAERDAQRQRVL